jgi:hypothetical protein
MKNCSYCGLENDESMLLCAGCGKEFTEAARVDPVLLDPEEDLVVLARCRTVVEANMLKLRLESAGVEACVPEELNPQIFWYAVPSPLEEVTVRVRARDLAAARDIMADPGSPTPPPPPLSPQQPPPLPPPPPAKSSN